MADGWAVQVRMQVLGGGSSTQLYYAHIPGRLDAEQAVKRHVAATPDVEVEAKEPVSHDKFVTMNVPEGGITQWQ